MQIPAFRHTQRYRLAELHDPLGRDTGVLHKKWRTSMPGAIARQTNPAFQGDDVHIFIDIVLAEKVKRFRGLSPGIERTPVGLTTLHFSLRVTMPISYGRPKGSPPSKKTLHRGGTA